ncbi:MAG: HAMP domain-containing histidine kinase [Sphingobacteriales bacterium]|nr:MAG: HAMP domain-containing histidine kinase [Sphingobacteriales bacterium]
MRQYINWKTYLILVALAIVGTSLLYTNKLAAELEEEEKKGVHHLVEGLKTMATATDPNATQFAATVVDANETIPLILTDEHDEVLYTSNIDSSRLKRNKDYLNEQIVDYKAQNRVIVMDYGFGKQKIYYGESYLLTQLRYYPYIQLGIIFLFLFVVLVALTSAHRSLQNQVWVGMSKETAHQLGTPLSSIEAWLELLKDNEANTEAVAEMQKDLDRLKLVADRFGKVGSTPKLVEENLIERLRFMTEYMQKRAPSKVTIAMDSPENNIPVNMSGPLFDWVVENLIRNALDAMDGKGRIDIKVTNRHDHVNIDVCDTGKGMPKHQVAKIFNPGYTTKKRGWGLGLSLARRIIQKYHHGSIFVKTSEPGKGTTFRITLKHEHKK